MTIDRKFTSASGMRSYMRSRPWSSEMPTRWPSTISRNSGPTGAGVSEAITRIESETGKPAFRLRTMMSMASANSRRNASSRRLRMKPRNQRGRPSAPATTASNAM